MSLRSTQASTVTLVSSEFIYETAPFPQCHASTIVETATGLVAAWFGGTAERNPDVGIWVARQERRVDNAGRSGERRTARTAPSDLESVLFQPTTGPMYLFYKAGPSRSAWWGMVMSSTDGGRTWTRPVRLADGILAPIKNKPVQLANGDILAGSSTENNGWQVHFERSTDNGRTWTATPPINDGQTIAAIQPSILVHPGGRLQAVGRTRQGKIFDTWSEDQGRSWTQLALTSLPHPSAGLGAVTLRTGGFLIVYHHTAPGRSPLDVAVSQDGKTWDPHWCSKTPPDRVLVSAVIQTRDGRVTHARGTARIVTRCSTCGSSRLR